MPILAFTLSLGLSFPVMISLITSAGLTLPSAFPPAYLSHAVKTSRKKLYLILIN